MALRRTITLLLAMLATLAGAEPSELSGTGVDAEQDQRRFTNTQRWDPVFLAFTRATPRHLPDDWGKRIIIPAPPANSSPRTRAELAHLHEIRESRAEKRGEVRRELTSDGFQFGKHRYGILLKSTERPATRRMLDAMTPDLSLVIFSLKHRHDRIRPSVLDPGLGHLFPVPGHPAYPSGHSTQAFTIAYLLEELDPARAEIYRKDALRIARNREIAGFHYPSDTEAGRLAARQFVDLLLADPEFRLLLDAAKEEW
ncbi:hypothetical protein [Haloferula sp. A504]|uniref:hypothetical protein n=1 Tax=Haloferula sp. A504 TaxID=3373601 RepID=UPI0031C93435|nr:phosphatase PAP2 family protein [Verrucomicrobiaceae bacterium E54]